MDMFPNNMNSYWLYATTMQILFVVKKIYINTSELSVSNPSRESTYIVPFLCIHYKDDNLVKIRTLQLLTETPTTPE